MFMIDEFQTMGLNNRGISEQLQMEDWLKKLSRVVEQTPAIVMITTTDGTIEYVNPAFEQVTGYRLDEVLGKNPRLLKSGLVPMEIYQDMWATITSGGVWRGELCNRKKNGELYWDFGTVSSIKDPQGKITNYISVKEDITGRKRIEQELQRYREHLEELVAERTRELTNEIDERLRAEAVLRESEQRLAEAQRIGQLGSWEWNIQSGEMLWSDQTYRICGLVPGNGRMTYESARKLIHPEEVDFVDQSLRDAILKNHSLNIDHRILLPDGQLRHVNLNAIPVYDAAGNPVKAVGTLQDITERVRIKAELLEKEQLTRELAIGQSIQLSMLPKRTPLVDGWQFAVHYQAAHQVGGDFYDFIELPNGRIGIVIADVSGKGVPAALYMALSRAIVRTVALGDYSPATTLVRSNQILSGEYSTDDFVTASYAILDTSNGLMKFANGGHTRPLWYVAGSQQVQEIYARGIVLGLFKEISLDEVDMKLNPGDALVFYTDGLSEADDAQGHYFGVDRLKGVLTANGAASANGILEEVINNLQNFVGDHTQFDDLTVVVIKRSNAN